MDQRDIERLWKQAADATARAKFCADDSEVQAAAEAFKRAAYEVAGKRPCFPDDYEAEWPADLFEVERRALAKAEG